MESQDAKRPEPLNRASVGAAAETPSPDGYYAIWICWKWTLAAVPLGCLLATIEFGLEAVFRGRWDVSELVWVVPWLTGMAAMVGIVPAMACGAPLYAFFAALFRPSVIVAVIIGGLPGLVGVINILNLDPYRSYDEFESYSWSAEWVLRYGIAVAVVLHCLVRKKNLALRRAMIP